MLALPAPSALHVCPRCRGDFVFPVDWEATSQKEWRMTVRCGECDDERELVVPNAEAARFDEVLHRQQAAIACAAERLDRERMASEVEAFVSALAADLVGPDDFAGQPGRPW